MNSTIRTFLLTTIGLMSFVSARAQSQNVIKVNILSPIVRTGNFSYERAMSPTQSFQLGVFFTGYRAEETRFGGFGITPEYRFYLSNSKQAPAGFYVAPFVRYRNFSVKNTVTADKGSLNTYGGGLIAGYQLIFQDRFSLDFFLGPQYSAGTIKTVDGSINTFSLGGLGSGFGLRSGITFGLAF